MQILQPPHWPRPKGYSNGIATKGRLVFVSGMIGWDAEERLAGNDLISQTRQALQNIVEVLAEAGAKPEHIARMTWYVVDRNEYIAASKALGAIYREIIGPHYPAMTAVQVMALIVEQARVEIEVTAVLPD